MYAHSWDSSGVQLRSLGEEAMRRLSKNKDQRSNEALDLRESWSSMDRGVVVIRNVVDCTKDLKKKTESSWRVRQL